MNLENSTIKAPFTVPEGYFNELEERLLSEARVAALSPLPRPAVPDHYFESLENRLNALARISSLKPEVPENYFQSLENQVLSRVNIEGLSRPSVEAGYFEELEAEVLMKVRMGTPAAPVVPDGYFTTLEKDILNKTVGKPAFTLFRNIRVWRNAAAVVVIGLMAWFGLQSPAPKDELADISTAAMISYLSEQPLMEEDLNFLLTEDDLFLTTEISDNEIKAYLLENGINI